VSYPELPPAGWVTVRVELWRSLVAELTAARAELDTCSRLLAQLRADESSAGPGTLAP